MNNKIRFRGERILLHSSYLIELGLKPGTIKSYTNPPRNKWLFEYDKEDNSKWVIADTITGVSKQKIPTHTELTAIAQQGEVSAKAAALIVLMTDAKKEAAQYVTDLKNQYNLKPALASEYAQRVAVWTWITDHYNGDLSSHYEAYKKVMPTHKRAASSKNGFSNVRKACMELGIEKAVIDGRSKATAKRRISDRQYAFIREVYADDRKFSSTEIYRKLILICKEWQELPCSHATVKLYMQQFKKDASVYGRRYGVDKLKQRLTYQTHKPAAYRNSQWQIDGWTLPFWSLGNNKRYVLVAVMDNHSKRIVGCAVGVSENTETITEAIEDAIRTTGVLPGEMVMDKHSFHKTEVADGLKEAMERRGVVWTVSMNAQRKAVAERYFQYLDSICKNYSGYLGKGITAKGADARRNKETYTKLISKSNQRTHDETILIAADIVDVYNKQSLPALNGLTPIAAYEQSTDKHALPVTTGERVAIMKPKQSYTVTRGQITIKRGVVKHEYQLPAALCSLYEGEKVTVVYEDLRAGIYIVDPRTEDTYAIDPKEKIQGAIVEQTDRDRELINRSTGRNKGVVNQTSKTGNKHLQEFAENDPESAATIAAHTLPKDIRAVAEQNRSLQARARDLGANPNNLPDRNIKSSTPVYKSKQGKKKKSPYAPKNNVMGILDRDAIARMNDYDEDE